MAFSDFEYPDVIAQLGLTETSAPNLFEAVAPIPVGPVVRSTITAGTQLALTINTEKARSEWLIAPVLGEFWTRHGGRVSLFSGVEFAADPANNLSGYCDFLIGRGPQLPHLKAP